MATVFIGSNPSTSIETCVVGVGAAVAQPITLTIDQSATIVGGVRQLTMDEVMQGMYRIMAYIQQNQAALGILP